MAASPVITTAQEMLSAPSDEETLLMYQPQDELSKQIDSVIQGHPLAISLRGRADLAESRPHLKIPTSQREHHFTGGVLMGPGRLDVPPYMWIEAGGKSLVSILFLGKDLCGHPGVVHGGLLATMLDEGLARCCFGALPNKIGMTANLNINYMAPVQAGSYVVLRARTTKVEGRKAWVEGRIETLAVEGEQVIVLAKATGLFIEPKQASTMMRVYPVS